MGTVKWHSQRGKVKLPEEEQDDEGEYHIWSDHLTDVEEVRVGFDSPAFELSTGVSHSPKDVALDFFRPVHNACLFAQPGDALVLFI